MADTSHATQRDVQEGQLSIRPEHACLIVLEGIDLSGRTTQVQLLQDWLRAQDYPVATTAWRTSPLISSILSNAKTQPLRPLSYSLLYCADHMDRTQHVIRPALQRGEIVLADRYTYTAFARDAARGFDPAWTRDLYRFSVQPDIVFYLHISPEEAVKRRLVLQRLQADAAERKGQQGKKEKRNGKEEKHGKKIERGSITPGAAWSQEGVESFRNFEKKMYSEYQNMQKEFGFHVLEGNQSIDLIQAELRRAILRRLLGM